MFYYCNITYITSQLGIKKETRLFEYLESRSLQSITNVINATINNQQIVKRRGNVKFLLTMDIYLSLYRC